MGIGCISSSRSLCPRRLYSFSKTTSISCDKSEPQLNQLNSVSFLKSTPTIPIKLMSSPSPSPILPLKCGNAEEVVTKEEIFTTPILDYHAIDENLLQKVAYDALVWSSLHGLVVGDKSAEKSGSVPGVGLMHAPFALLPTSFPESHWTQACDLAPIFNELVDRVSLDGKFLQESLSRTKKVDEFTSRLLDIHSKMLEIKKREDIRLGLHRSDYMIDEQTKSLLQIEMNTISSSFAGLGSLVTDLHQNILSHYGKLLGLDPKRIPANAAASRFAEALAKAWSENNNPRAVVMFVVQTEERNMYDQHWLSVILRERHNITSTRKTLAEIDQEGELLPDGTLSVDGQAVAVVYFRAGYTPIDYPSESEWRARLLIERSSAIKCPSISYHLAGTKKIQQQLAKPNVLERSSINTISFNSRCHGHRISSSYGIRIITSFLLPCLLSPDIHFATAQPGSSNEQTEPYPYNRFSPSMAIIVFTLIAALLLMAFFSIYIDHRSDSPNNSDRPPARGLDPAVNGASECAICLKTFKQRRILTCGHVFHTDCINRWLASHTTCPICRADVESNIPRN